MVLLGAVKPFLIKVFEDVFALPQCLLHKKKFKAIPLLEAIFGYFLIFSVVFLAIP